MGENLCSGSGSWANRKTLSEVAETASNRWYDEIQDYNWDEAKFTMGTGHFTQVHSILFFNPFV